MRQLAGASWRRRFWLLAPFATDVLDLHASAGAGRLHGERPRSEMAPGAAHGGKPGRFLEVSPLGVAGAFGDAVELLLLEQGRDAYKTRILGV